MKSSTLYRWLEWTFQPQTCTEVFPVIGLQEDNTEEITRVYTATFASPEVFEQLERLDANTCMLFTHHPKPQRLNTADPPPQISQKWLDFLKERRSCTSDKKTPPAGFPAGGMRHTINLPGP